MQELNGARDGIVGSERQTGLKWWSTAGLCALFSVIILAFILFGYRVQSRNFHLGIIITEFILISLPAVIYLTVAKLSPRETLRLNRTRFLNFVIVFFIMIFAIPLAAVFNLINLYIVDTVFGKVIVEPMPLGETGLELLLSVLVIAGSAGICEEFVFRGVLQRGFETFGKAKAILLTAFLFSLTHLDFQKILGTFVLGVLIGFIVYRTNSLWCGMFAHFTNNAIAVLAGYVSNKLSELLKETGNMVQPSGDSIGDIFDLLSEMPRSQQFAVMLVYGFLLVFCAIIFSLFIYLLIRQNPLSSAQPGQAAEGSGPAGDGAGAGTPAAAGSKAKGLLWLTPAFLLIGLWYYTQACSFLGIGNGITEVFRLITGAV